MVASWIGLRMTGCVTRVRTTTMSARLLSTYDELPYACHLVQWANPDNLACKARLHGLRAPEVETCRVLELGCGTGANLLPLAQALPKASLVGVDYAQRQILHGKAIVDTVGVKNLELHAMSLADVDEQLGSFDYILCHGVYSWVAPELQKKILEVIQDRLAPNGVAYVSYNTYPGWHLRGLVREILCHQTARAAEPMEQVQRAKKYLDFLIQFTPDQDGIYAKILRREREILSKTPDTYLFHEHLEELNQPLYFHQFAERAAQHQLQFLSEASYHPEEANFSEAVQEQLAGISRDRIDYEQQVDFLCNGTFRRTLLCRDDVSLTSQPSILALRDLRIRSRARASSTISDLQSNKPEEFLGAHGQTVTTSHPLIKAALLCLNEAWPRTLALDELYDRTNARLQATPNPVVRLHETELLSKAILRCYKTDVIQLSTIDLSCAAQLGQKPTVSPLTRWQATHQEPVSNLMHEVVDVNDFDRLVAGLMDGTRDRTAICQAVVDAVCQGTIDLQHQGKPVTDREVITAVADQSLSQCFEKFIELALVVE